MANRGTKRVKDILPFLEDFAKRSRCDGIRELIAVFHNPHRKMPNLFCDSGS